MHHTNIDGFFAATAAGNDVCKQANAPTVAVIGAGPAGLVAAKSMMEAGLVPTVFERAARVGGMWASKSGTTRPSLRTNLSKFACAFSDHPWARGTPMFPTQVDVESYLSDYASTHLQAHVDFCMEHQVMSAQPRGPTWVIETLDSGAVRRRRHFDYLVIASGFLADAYCPDIPGLSTFAGHAMHSADYTEPEAFAGQCVAVVGGSLSAVEIAADIAPVAARVVHVAPRPFWVVPRFIPHHASLPASPLMPLDLVFYRRSCPGPVQEIVCKDGRCNAGKNRYMRAMAGAYAAHLPALLLPNEDEPQVAISDGYMPMLASRRIDARLARLERVVDGTLELSNGDELSQIDTVVLCTGYRPNLSFFDAEVQRILQWDEGDMFMPLTAHRSVFHPELPKLAFVGMYRGPYFGVMEAQARWAAAVFSGSVSAPTRDVLLEGVRRETALKNLLVRPQFPHGDYVGLMDETYGMFGIRAETANLSAGSSVVPAHYRPDSHLSRALAHELKETLKMMHAGNFNAAGVFYGLAGAWNFTRLIRSRKAAMPSGVVRGRADFVAGTNRHSWDYREEGELVTGDARLDVSRRYRYMLDPSTGGLHVYFASGENAGDMFHPVTFASDADRVHTQDDVRCASGHRLCGGDSYRANYAFAFCGTNLSAFTITYDVSGPNKDYTSHTQFERPAAR